jgi:superfamily II DNA or RNA helicase
MALAGYITAVDPIYTGAMSAYPYSADLEARYTFISTFKDTICGAIRQGNTLLVPRESVPYAEGKNDYRVSYPIHAIDCIFTPHNEEQLPLCINSIALLKADHNHIFQAPTGHGKTVEGAYIACQMGQPTLIIVTKDDLVEQWRKAFIEILGVPANLVGHIQQDKCDWQGKQFVIGLVQSLIIPDRYPAEMYKYFGMLILDEVHLMAADCFVRSCQMFPAKYRLGLSATPKRRDGKDKLLQWHIGPIAVVGTIVSMKPKILIRHTGWKIPCHKKLVGNSWEYVPIPHKPGRMMLVLKAMAMHPMRNQEIINFTEQTYKVERITLIMSDLIDHLKHLFLHLTAAGIPGQEIAYYIGGMSKQQRESSKKGKVVLATYKMCSTGTDMPHWDSLVLATPRADIMQPMGRVLRALQGKKQPVILDLVDADKLLVNFSLSRLKQYYSVGATIVNM